MDLRVAGTSKRCLCSKSRLFVHVLPPDCRLKRGLGFIDPGRSVALLGLGFVELEHEETDASPDENGWPMNVADTAKNDAGKKDAQSSELSRDSLIFVESHVARLPSKPDPPTVAPAPYQCHAYPAISPPAPLAVYRMSQRRLPQSRSAKLPTTKIDVKTRVTAHHLSGCSSNGVMRRHH